jgi:SAM-dependent methyltransferase
MISKSPQFSSRSKRLKCCACGNTRLSNSEEFPTHSILICTSCGSLFEEYLPSIEEISACYGIYSYRFRKTVNPSTQLSYNKILDYFESIMGSPGSVLDIGCGQGDFLVSATKKGWKAQGTEYSESAIQLCVNYGLDVYSLESSRSMLQGSYNLVTLFEVVEHLLCPNSVLSEAYQLLQPGGFLYITTPNASSLLRLLEKDNFQILRYPEHLIVFTPSGLRSILASTGFEVLRIYTTGFDLERFVKFMRSLHHRIFHSIPSRIYGTKRVKMRMDKSESPVECARSIESSLNEKLRRLSQAGPFSCIKTLINHVLSIFVAGDTIKVVARKPTGLSRSGVTPPALTSRLHWD